MEFRLLGPLEVADGGRQIEVGRAKTRVLLAILLLKRGRVVSKNELVDGLWEAHPPGNPTATLHSHVSALRRVLEPGVEPGGHQVVVTSASGYALMVAPDHVDIARFEAAAGEASRALAQQHWSEAATAFDHALGEWRGQALADFREREFARAAAARLEEARWAALEKRAEAWLALGRHVELVGELEALVAEAPLRERLWAQLMLALYRSDRQADALAAYQTVRLRLADEFGLEPAPELRRLEEAVLLQKSELDWTPPATHGPTVGVENPPANRKVENLPPLLTPLIGRERQVADVTGLLTRARLVTLTGAGGVGKTRLAIAAAQQALPSYRDGVVFVPLAAVTDAALVLRAIANALQLPDEPGQTPLASVCKQIGSRNMLLVLDNFERVAPAAAEVVQVLGACPNLTVLATSRVALRISGEQRYPVPPLALPPQGTVIGTEVLARCESVELYAERAREADPGFVLDQRSGVAVAELCVRLDGLPLAIELAAARAAVLTPQEIAERLDHRLDVLTGGGIDLPPRQRTLRATLDWSHELLAPAVQRLFARLGVFSGGATLEAVEATCTDGGGLGAVEGLTALVDSGLVRSEPVNGRQRFRMLETVREYALERLHSSGEAFAMRSRHAAFMCTLAERDRPPPGLADNRRLEWLDTESDNLDATLRWSLDAGEIHLCARLAAGLHRWWYRTGRFSEGRQWLAAILPRSAGLPTAVQAELLAADGSLAANQADFAHASARFRQSRQKWEEAGLPAGQARCLAGLAAVLISMNEPRRAVALLENALQLARQAGDSVTVIRTLANLGAAAESDEQYTRAAGFYEQALAVAEDTGSVVDVSRASASLALVELATGNPDRAAELVDRALETARATGSPTLLASGLVLAGVVALERSDSAAAHACYREALAIYRDTEQTAWVGDCLHGLAAAARLRGDLAGAARLFGAAAGLLESAGIVPERGVDRNCYDHHLTALRTEMEPGAFCAGWEEGHAMPHERAVAYALDPVAAAV